MNELKCTTIFTSLSAVILSTSVTGYEYGNKSCRLVTFYTLTGDECCSIFALRVRWRVLAWAPYALPAALRRLLNKMRLHFIVTFYWFSEWPASELARFCCLLSSWRYRLRFTHRFKTTLRSSEIEKLFGENLSRTSRRQGFQTLGNYIGTRVITDQLSPVTSFTISNYQLFPVW